MKFTLVILLAVSCLGLIELSPLAHAETFADRAVIEANTDLSGEHTFGEYMEFAKGYNAILYSEDKPIYPMYSFLPDYAEPSRFYPEIPAYVAGCVYKFPVENLNQSSALKLLITSPDGKELEFPFDLVKIK